MTVIEWATKNPELCNCGGYALGLKRWYKPFDCTARRRERAMVERLHEGVTIEELKNEILAQDTKFMVENFGGALSTIENPRLIPNSEKVIAYRICVDKNCRDLYTDYHFKVRDNGVWSHKQGVLAPEECELEEDKPWELLEDDDETVLHYYDSPIQYFVLKEKI